MPYRHAYAGSVASLGLHKGVAQVYGVKLKGFPAWFMHRTYHVSRVPTFNRKARVVADWTLACCSAARSSPSGQLQDPRREFVFAANTGRAGHLPPPRTERPPRCRRRGTEAPARRTAPERHRYRAQGAPVAQLAEAGPLKGFQCRFDPDRGHSGRGVQSPDGSGGRDAAGHPDGGNRDTPERPQDLGR